MKVWINIIWISLLAGSVNAEKPNIILVFADDISARELPIYNSDVWSKPGYGNTDDPALRAQTPVLDKLAEEGCWIRNAWAATICSPSRAMMMTGRYAHLHKWWHNGDYGKSFDEQDRKITWPLYESSPVQLGQVAQQVGYGTYWAGKTQMTLDHVARYGFDEGIFTPGGSITENPSTDFQIIQKKVDGKKVMVNRDSGLPGGSFPTFSYFWMPSVQLLNHPSAEDELVLWPNTPKTRASFGPHTYGPDLEMEFIFDFMDRTHEKGKPFFIYHTSHLGHGAFDWLRPEDEGKWPGTPVIEWTGKGYVRTEPRVTGDKGKYDTHGTVTPSGIHHQINYLDYQMWCYQNKLEELGIAEDTIIIFCADNGTHGYGKGNMDRQKGVHVPLIIYAPGMKKRGEQDILVSIADMLPTVAELVGADIPADYEINGESLVPFLFTEKADHRDWLYSYKSERQLARGNYVLKDGKDKWWDVSTMPADLNSFRQITDWSKETELFREERKKLLSIIKPFDLYATEHDAPSYKSDRKGNE
ncbi:sulfatase-like hydrolase/transferase [Pontiella sulfatireligans]|uniref:Sulfatase N-terminal domain-containing protein n=1 Tax=Pontiella sulfatireligans TaxID=2750658 RepID=A0A6C2UTA6_9BACT|nr:sulfatase-like hydrolase/transferase [Pontiella sulfatireligans]SPS74509.1 sulfatase S1_24 [Kiritimatiellales bacterium]VGO22447.1 hypothetical protein SCARR_04530 [Pontiella sulfatireligans]